MSCSSALEDGGREKGLQEDRGAGPPHLGGPGVCRGVGWGRRAVKLELGWRTNSGDRGNSGFKDDE